MSKRDKLLKKAKESPGNLSFAELCLLAEYAGFEFRNQTGSHKIYKHPRTNEMLNFQSDNGKAKKYQIRQLVAQIEEHSLWEK